eukprot:GHVL01038998.1.p1 GENE.GHVL01038998.1~~GHVL01038998.1.p1  ORF type:complete len:568 (+),score=68.64 GHVL01038998.1:195-1706(+)
MSSLLNTKPLEEISEAHILNENLLKNWKLLVNGKVPEWITAEDNSVSLFPNSDDLSFYHFMNGYLDLLFSEQNHISGHRIRLLYTMHCLNHVLKGQASGEEASDKGFTRCRVLILAPTRFVCWEIVQFLTKLAPMKKKILNLSRFEEEYGSDDSWNIPEKQADYRHIMRGNPDDNFKIGLAFQKSSVRLYSPFYGSDIIIASPLGLKLATGVDVNESDAENEEIDTDILSSIEVLVCDRLDMVRQQNIQHLESVLNSMNKMPKKLRDADITCLRPAFVDDKSRFLRQSILLTDGKYADVKSIFRRLCTNYRGKLELGREVNSSLVETTGLQHMFHKVYCRSPIQLHDDICKAFCEKLWPQYLSQLDGLLIVLPGVLDYLQVVSHLKQVDETEWCACTEHSTNKQLSKSRVQFFEGKKRFMFITERFLFFKRYKIKGVKNVFFYTPPRLSSLFAEILTWVDNQLDAVSIVSFTNFDGFALERLAGKEKSRRMLNGTPNKIYLFN